MRREQGFCPTVCDNCVRARQSPPSGSLRASAAAIFTLPGPSMIDSITQLVEAGYEPHPKHWRPALLADPCAYCGAPSREIDHIVPTAMDNASNGYSACDWNHTNMIGACRRCNRRKKCHSLLAFLSGLPV